MIDIKILFLFRLTVNAAAIDPNRLIVGVPISRLKNKIREV